MHINSSSSYGGSSDEGLKINYTLQYFDKALAIQPNNVKALYNKGLVLGSLGNYTEAIKYYDKALAIQPNDFDVQNNKANALAKLGKGG